MTRYLYGATPSDVTFNSDGGLAPAATITLWNARSGGAQVIDLQTVGGSSISSVTSDSLGFIAFLGPDGYTGTLWADGGVGDRVALFPVEASNAASYLPTASISELSDVDTTTDAPGDGDALVWDTAEGKWAPGSVSGGVVNVIDYGAAGDGTTDDTDAIRDAIDALRDDQTLLIPAGSTFKHTNYLRIDGRQRIRVTGGGTLAHSGDVDGTSSLMLIDCDDVVVSNITLTSSATTRRDGNESHRLFVHDSTSVTIKDIAIDGSQAAGVLLQTVTNFLIENVSASNTLADSFHFTHGSSYGTVRHCSSTGSGDDGFAVVSYDTHPTPCAYINFFHCSVASQIWGRGLTVVGGDHIDYSDCHVNGSSGAGIYIACEGEYDTYGATNITARDIVLDGCVQQAAEVAGDRPRPDQAQLIHGAVTIYGSRTEYSVDGVQLSRVTILNTEPGAWYEVMLVNYNVDEQVTNVDLSDFTFTSDKTLATTTLLGDEDFNFRNWVKSGTRQDDVLGFDYRGMTLSSAGGSMRGALVLAGDPENDLEAATKQYADNAGGGVFNVKNFGALGDGSTDDRAAIQAALDAVPSRGGTVFFPSGVYLISKGATRGGGTYGGLFPKAKTRMLGEGQESCIKLNNGTDKVDVIYADSKESLSLENLQIDAGDRATPYNTTCLQLLSCGDLTIRNVVLSNGNIEGGYIHGADNFRISDLLTHYNGAYRDDASGLHIDSSAHGVISNVISHDNGFHGIILSTCHDLMLSNISTYDNGYQGIHIQTGTTRCVFSNIVSNNNARGVYIKDSGTTQLSFSNLTVLNNAWDGVMTNVADELNIDGFGAYGNGEHGLFLYDGGDRVNLGWATFAGNSSGDIGGNSGYVVNRHVLASDIAGAGTFDLTSGVTPLATVPDEIDYVTATAADAAYQGNIVVRNVAAIIRALEVAGIAIVND